MNPEWEASGMTAPADNVDPKTGSTGNDDLPKDPTGTVDPPATDPPAKPPEDKPPADKSPTDKLPADKLPADKPPADTTDWKARSRQWEDKAKTNKTAAEERDQLKLTMQAIAAALDPNGNNDDDPAEIAERAVAERDAKDSELKSLRIERAAERAGRKHGADVDALLDSRGFITAIGKLDPADDSFSDRLDDLVKKAVEDNPRLKAAASPSTAPTRSSPDPGGTKDTTGQLTRADLASMSPEQIVEARKAGRLTSLLKGASA